MRNLIWAALISVAVFTGGCIVVPVDHDHDRHYYHCGWYHCR